MVVDVRRGIRVADHDLLEIRPGRLEQTHLLEADTGEQRVRRDRHRHLALGGGDGPEDAFLGRRDRAVVRCDLAQQPRPDARRAEALGEIVDEQLDDLRVAHAGEPGRVELLPVEAGARDDVQARVARDLGEALGIGIEAVDRLVDEGAPARIPVVAPARCAPGPCR